MNDLILSVFGFVIGYCIGSFRPEPPQDPRVLGFQALMRERKERSKKNENS